MRPEELDEIEKKSILLYKKAQAYKNLGTKVHVTKEDERWANGVITEVSADFFMIDDMVSGIQPVFFMETKNIENFTEKNKQGGNKEDGGKINNT